MTPLLQPVRSLLSCQIAGISNAQVADPRHDQHGDHTKAINLATTIGDPLSIHSCLYFDLSDALTGLVTHRRKHPRQQSIESCKFHGKFEIRRLLRLVRPFTRVQRIFCHRGMGRIRGLGRSNRRLTRIGIRLCFNLEGEEARDGHEEVATPGRKLKKHPSRLTLNCTYVRQYNR